MEVRESQHILQNLDQLIKYTVANTALLAYIKSHAILSYDDVDELNYIHVPTKKVRHLYSILIQRTGAYQILTQALLETNQTAAYSILKKLNEAPSDEEPKGSQSQFTSMPNGLDDFLQSDGRHQLMILCTLDSNISSKRITETAKLKAHNIQLEGNKLNSTDMAKILSQNIVCVKLPKPQIMMNYIATHKLPWGKKIVVITEQKKEAVLQDTAHQHGISVSIDEFKWLDLTTTFKGTLLQRNISDQGRVKTLQAFCTPVVYENMDEYLSRFLNAEILVDLINNMTPVIYRQTVPAVKFYVPRKIHRRSFANPSLFAHGSQHSVNDVFIFSGFRKRNELSATINRAFMSSEKLLDQQSITAQYIWLMIDEHFQNIYSKISTEKNIHWFVKIDEQVMWNKSRGSISSIANFIQTSPNPTFMYEDEFLRNLEQQQGDGFSSPYICICDTPGMGKSVLLAILGRQLMKNHPDRRVIFVVFTEFMEVVRQAQEAHNSDTQNSKVVLEAISQLVSSRSFGGRLFKDNANQIIELLFDGLDEVQQEKINLAIACLKQITSVMKSARVFVTARPHLLHKLEKELNTFGYKIKPFESNDQEKFLKDFWSQNRAVLHKSINEEGLIIFAKACLKKLKSTLNNIEWNIAGIPLQCLLLAEVFSDKGNMYADPKNKITEEKAGEQVSIKSITELYERLVDKKLEAYEKRYLQKHLKKANKTCAIKVHGYLSFALMFPEWMDKIKKYLLTPNLHQNFRFMCLQSDCNQKEFLEGNIPTNDLLCMGFMESVEGDGKPQFIHRTFAEFFAAAFIIDLLKLSCPHEVIEFVQQAALQTESTETQVSKFVSQTGNLQKFKNPVVCYFLNALMKSNSLSSSQIPPKILNPSILSACSHNNLMQMFTCLSGSAPSFVNDQLLLTTVKNSSIEFVQLIISHHKPDRCVRDMVYIATERGDYEIFNLVFHLVETSKLLKTDSELFNLMSACVFNTQNDTADAIEDKIEILNLLLHKNTANLNYDHLLLCPSVHINLLLELITSCKDILVADNHLRKTVLHKCVEYLSPSDYNILVSNIEGDKLQMLLKCRDYILMTPLHQLVTHQDPKEETIELFSKNGADFNAVDDCGNYVLSCAIYSNRSKECLELLIKYGADQNNVDKFGRNALHIAAMHSNLSLIRWLVDHMKIEPNTQDSDGNAPLYYSLHNETAYQTIICLIGAGANAKILNNEKRSLLHFAAQRGNPKPFQFLLQQGLDMLARDGRGNTVLHHALYGPSAEKAESILKLVPLPQLMKVKNKKGETAVSRLLNQNYFSVDVTIVEYLALNVGEWDDGDINIALTYLETKGKETGDEKYSSLISLINSKRRD